MKLRVKEALEGSQEGSANEAVLSFFKKKKKGKSPLKGKSSALRDGTSLMKQKTTNSQGVKNKCHQAKFVPVL